MTNLLLSAFSDEYSSIMDEQLEMLKDNNIKFIELRFVDSKNFSELNFDEVKVLKKKLDKYGIKVSSIGSPIGKIKITGDLDTHFEMAERVFKYANYLSVKIIRMFSFYIEDGESFFKYKDDIFNALERLVNLSEKYSVTLCHENEAKIYGESPERCLEILKHFNGRMKCVLDMGNFVLDGYDPYKAYETLYDYIEYFHIKDSLYEGAIVPAGKGDARIKDILDDYKKKENKETFITLEPHLETFGGLNQLVGKSFKNPYKFENQKVAFLTAIESLRELL